MILLVAYTLHGDDVYIYEMLIFVRMPLFFFVSGLFSYRLVTAMSFRTLIRDKVSNFIYLYVLWEVILYLVIRVVSHHVRRVPPRPRLSSPGEPADVEPALESTL